MAPRQPRFTKEIRALELRGRALPPEALDPSALPHVRASIAERLVVIARAAAELQADHALAVEADRRAPGDRPGAHREEMDSYIVEEEIPKRFERLEKLARVLLPELAGDCDSTRRAVHALEHALRAPEVLQLDSAEWRASDALLQRVAEREIERGESAASQVGLALEAVRVAVKEQARWGGEIGSLPLALESVLRVVIRAEAGIGELEDRNGRRTATGEEPQVLIEQLRRQHTLAASLLRALAEEAPAQTREELDRALCEQRAENWVERERWKALQREDAPQYSSVWFTELEERDEWAYSTALDVIERSGSESPELRARAIEVAQARIERALRTIKQDLEQAELDEDAELELC